MDSDWSTGGVHMTVDFQLVNIFFVLSFMLMEEVNRDHWNPPIKEKGEFHTVYPDLRHFRKRFIGKSINIRAILR